jgi:glucokinase
MYRVLDCSFVDRERLVRLSTVHIISEPGVSLIYLWALPGVIRQQKQQTSAELICERLKDVSDGCWWNRRTLVQFLDGHASILHSSAATPKRLRQRER